MGCKSVSVSRRGLFVLKFHQADKSEVHGRERNRDECDYETRDIMMKNYMFRGRGNKTKS